MDQNKYLDMPGLQHLWRRIKQTFVEQDGDMTLSDNNYTDEDKTTVATVVPIGNNIIDEIFDK